MKEIAAFFNLPFEDIQEIVYEISQPMYDHTGDCFFEGSAYFVAYTIYGARIEIAEIDSRFLQIKKLIEIDLSLQNNKVLYTRS
ncbi:hypothetical protein I6G82_22345 [Lysinibacillus macroides]|uniref:Uncharacterized protein n=1 Tax=Lysinibacillus macroides TaxID=33935 RepID=A0A0M9DJA7_9BACI|nr:hypothetical protein [Lysinibacillus macroides]KOY81773.1 hypothetical protein ADM90_12700 [Lysinibacillus macroides]QPR67879.1 hypothetical protein I6G82_22345 [Lysinibacillus macroides]